MQSGLRARRNGRVSVPRTLAVLFALTCLCAAAVAAAQSSRRSRADRPGRMLRSNALMVGVGIGAAVPVADDRHDLDVGTSFSGWIGNVNRSGILSLSFDYMKHDMSIWPTAPDEQSRYRLMAVMFNYTFLLSHLPRSRVRPYLGLGVGVALAHRNLYGADDDDAGSVVGAGSGIWAEMGESTHLEVGGRYLIASEFSGHYQAISATARVCFDY